MEQATDGKRKGGRKALWAAVAVIAIAAAGSIGYKVTLEKTIAAQLEKRGGKAASVNADFLGRIHLTDVTLPLKDGSDVRIASVEGRPKILFVNGMLEATGVSTEFAHYKISVPHLRIDDANFDRKMLTETFGNSELTLAERVARFSASRVTLSEVDVLQTIAGKEQKVVYKDVALENVDKGHIARYSAAGATLDFDMDVVDANGKKISDRMQGSIGSAEGKDIDGVFLARLYTEKAGPDDTEAKPVYGPFSAKNIVLTANDSSFGYDEIRSGGFTMRLPTEPLLDTLDKIGGVTDPDALTPEERKQFFLRLVSIFDMIGKGDIEIAGFKIKSKEPKESGSVDHIGVAFDDRKLNLSLKGFAVGDATDYMKVDEVSLDGFSWASSVEALRKFAALDDAQAESFPPTTLLPEFGTLQVKGVSGDLPNDQETDEDGDADASVPALPDRLKFAVKNYVIALNKPVNGIPSDVRIAYEDMEVPVPVGDDEVFQKLRKLGFDRVVMSSNVEANWDEPNQSLVIKDFSVSGKDMGSVSLSGLMGGFTKEFFSGDKVLTQVAALGLKAREVKLKIEEKGLISKGIKLYAEENGVSEEDVRSSFSMMATMFLQELAADQPKFQDVVTAFSSFLAKPNIFELTVKARSEKGLGMLEMVAASQNPLSLLDKVDIEAKAE